MVDTPAGFSRRQFLTQASYFGAFYALAGAMPLAAMANSLTDDPRIAAALTVDLGACPVVIESFPGHSGTDLIVKVPEQKVVYTGDLMFNGSYPACFDEQASISGWRATFKTFASFDKDTIFVPGHGQVCGQEGVARIRSVFDDLAEQSEKMYKAGVPAGEAADLYVVPEKFKSVGIWSWGYCVGFAVTKPYAELDAK